jgi:hypothetical protein
MFLIVFQAIVQAISSTLYWLGFYVGIQALPGHETRRTLWSFGSAVLAAVWLIGVFWLAVSGFFRNDVRPPRIPLALITTLLFGYLLLLSPTVRRIIAAVPQHWLIGIHGFRILGGVFLVRYFAGQLPGLFAIPAGLGDLATGLLAPVVAYAWYSGKPYARSAAIAWNLFGMVDLVNAVLLGTITNVGAHGLVFPLVLIPVYAVPRAFLIHSYSLIGLVRRTARQPQRAESLHYGAEAAAA